MKIKLSVSDLVSFACRTGDLVNAGPAGPSARDGIKAHQKLQSEVPPRAETEVSFKREFKLNDYSVVLGGRIDILIADDSHPEIQEIKSTLVAPLRIADSVKEQHWAQLKVYGYCYLLDAFAHELLNEKSIDLTLLWYNLLDETVSADSRKLSFPELEIFTLDALQIYVDWAARIEKWRECTRETARELSFPHGEFRAGQRDLAAATYRVFRDTGHFLCEAPTGIGKTVSTLYPAVKAIGDGHISQVTWLTAKTSGRSIAMDTVKLMEDQGLQIMSLVISSKATTCHCSNGTCERDEDGRCPLTIGFFDRLPEAREELIGHGSMDSNFLNEVATRHQVCPFELSLQMIPWVSIVICDYNYVFDPLVVLTYYADPAKSQALLLDESHNLVDRARNMYSARLTRSQNRVVMDAVQQSHAVLYLILQRLDVALLRLSRQSEKDEFVEEKSPQSLNRLVGESVDVLVGSMENGPTLPEVARDWFRELFRYRVIDELFGDHHRVVVRVSKQKKYKDVELKLMCVNATDKLQRTLKKFSAVIAFSATLRPMQYYYNALGFPENAKTMNLASPFLEEQMACLVCPFVDTRYRARERSEASIVEIIASVVKAQAGNYLVFFPSYAYMEKVYRAYVLKYSEQHVIIQERAFTTEEREQFLGHFSGAESVLGFAILGGIFGEGIDYVGDKLIGCIVVGTGLPGLGIETGLISEDYQQAGLNGFDYTYRYPGFTRVLQTAGRVIRGETDRGVVVLVDQRFVEPFYSELYPEHWRQVICHTSSEFETALESFWQAGSDLLA